MWNTVNVPKATRGPPVRYCWPLPVSLVSEGEMCAEVDVMNVCILTLENSHVLDFIK